MSLRWILSDPYVEDALINFLILLDRTAKVGLKDNPIILSIMYFNYQFDRKSPKNAHIQTRGGGSFYCRNGPKFRLRLKKYINFDFKFEDFEKNFACR